MLFETETEIEREEDLEVPVEQSKRARAYYEALDRVIEK